MTRLTTQRAELEAFGAAHDYDVSYLVSIFEEAPASFAAFHAAQGMTYHREHLSREAHHVARIAAMHHQDCGGCAQLNLRLAVADGVDRSLLANLLRNPAELPTELAAVWHVLLAEDPAQRAQGREVVTEHFGAAGLAELAVLAAGCSIYPAAKRVLGVDESCEVVNLDF